MTHSGPFQPLPFCDSVIRKYMDTLRVKLGNIHINGGRTWLRISRLDADIINYGCDRKAICRLTRRF